jgi:uncharacterized membrane protein
MNILNGGPLVGRRTTILVSVTALVVVGLWLLGTPNGVMGKAVAVGYAICHRIVARSYLIGAEAMPLCARCTGIYLGVMTGLMFHLVRGRLQASKLPPWPIAVILALGALTMVFDGLNSYGNLLGFEALYTTQNWMRLVTGTLCGLAVITFILPFFNRVIWQTPTPIRIIDGLFDWALLLASGGLMIALVLSERPLILWVLGVLSVVGVLLLLTMIGTVFFISFNNLEKASRARQLLIPMLAGFTIGMLEIGAINILRFALTKSWDGFSIG